MYRRVWSRIPCIHRDPGEHGTDRIESLSDLIDWHMPEQFAFAEVGVFYGDVAEHLLTTFPRMFYTGVDLWAVQDSEVYNDDANNAEVLNLAYIHTLNRIVPFAGRTELYKIDSIKCAEEFYKIGVRFNMIYIDANHSTEAVYNDIIAWSKCLADGGILCGHDYCPGWESVKEGVDKAATVLGCEVKSCWEGLTNITKSSVWYY